MLSADIISPDVANLTTGGISPLVITSIIISVITIAVNIFAIIDFTRRNS